MERIKKAQIAIQFNWIFVLIAGALILIFFIGVVYKIRATSQESLACNVLTDLEAIITGASVSTGTSNLIDTPEVAEIEFVCDKDGFSQYNIKGSGCKKDTPIEPIFSPNLIQGRKLITWAVEFAAPFKVDNFLYLTHPQVKYVFLGQDPDPIKQYYNDLPDEINKIYLTSTGPGSDFENLEIEDNYQYKFIIGSTLSNTNIPSGLKKLKQIHQIKIEPDKIAFYEKSGPTSFTQLDQVVQIIPDDLPSIYAAIFAHDKESYECNMKKAYKRLAIISDVYSDKIRSLIQYYENSPLNCELFYQGDYLENIKQRSLECSSEIGDCAGAISSTGLEIRTTNQNLKKASCPMIY